MPYADIEKRREVIRESQRRRRAAAAVKDAAAPGVATSPSVKSRTTSPASNSHTPGFDHFPRNIPALLNQLPLPQMTRLAKYRLLAKLAKEGKLRNCWQDYPGRLGIPCCKAPGQCCLLLVLRYTGDLPKMKVASCIYPVPGCPFYRENSRFDAKEENAKLWDAKVQ